MSLNNALTNTGVILLIAAMTTTMFCGLQREPRATTNNDPSQPAPLFDSRLSDVMPEDQATRILVTIELFGELLFMLAMATGIAGIGLSVVEGISELFRELIEAVKRLFILKRQTGQIANSDDRDDDAGNSLVTRPLPPIPPRFPSRSPLIHRDRCQAMAATTDS